MIGATRREPHQPIATPMHEGMATSQTTSRRDAAADMPSSRSVETLPSCCLDCIRAEARAHGRHWDEQAGQAHGGEDHVGLVPVAQMPKLPCESRDGEADESCDGGRGSRSRRGHGALPRRT